MMISSALKLHLKSVSKALNFLNDEKIAKLSNKERRQFQSSFIAWDLANLAFIK